MFSLFRAVVPLTAANVSIGPEYVDTFYTRTVKEAVQAKEALSGTVSADVCVVGGGLAGVSAALGLAERGKKVVLIEKSRVASCASGMNGGMAIPGFAVEGGEFVRLVGEQRAGEMYGWTLEALAAMKRRVAAYKIDCDLRQCGMVTLSCSPRAEADAARGVAAVNRALGTQQEFWPAAKVSTLFKSALYHHAVFDPTVHVVHPLNLTLGLARAAIANGAAIYERTQATGIAPANIASGRRWCVSTDSSGNRGAVEADHVVLAGGSSLDDSVDAGVAHSLVPILTFIMYGFSFFKIIIIIVVVIIINSDHVIPAVAPLRLQGHGAAGRCARYSLHPGPRHRR
jgi:gamma-glutamylputrescine oxidase